MVTSSVVCIILSTEEWSLEKLMTNVDDQSQIVGKVCWANEA